MKSLAASAKLSLADSFAQQNHEFFRFFMLYRFEFIDFSVLKAYNLNVFIFTTIFLNFL